MTARKTKGSPQADGRNDMPRSPDERVSLTVDVHTASLLVMQAVATRIDPETFATAAIQYFATLPTSEQAALVARFGEAPRRGRIAAAAWFSDAENLLQGRITRKAYLVESGLGAILDRAGLGEDRDDPGVSGS